MFFAFPSPSIRSSRVDHLCKNPVNPNRPHAPDTKSNSEDVSPILRGKYRCQGHTNCPGALNHPESNDEVWLKRGQHCQNVRGNWYPAAATQIKSVVSVYSSLMFQNFCDTHWTAVASNFGKPSLGRQLEAP